MKGRFGQYRKGNIVKGRYIPRMCRNKRFCRDNSPVLESGYTVKQTWVGLEKAWLGYTIALQNEELSRRKYYATVIQKLQQELVSAGVISAISIADFPDLGLLAYDFENKFQKQLEEDLINYKPLEQLEWERSFSNHSSDY